MKNPKLRATWESDRGAVNGWLSIPSAVTAEIAAQEAFDSLVVDLQHGLIDYQTALGMLQALAAFDVTPMARVPWLEPGIIMKLLDAGALGIICPMVNTRADAEAFMRYTHYAPVGERSFGPTRALPAHGSDYPSRANDVIITLAMIETAQALANVSEIVATPGLTGVYIGPADLGLSLGFPPRLDHDEPVVVDAIKHILASCKNAGIRAGIHCLTPAYAKRMLTLGFDLVTLSNDVRLLSSAIAAVVSQTRG